MSTLLPSRRFHAPAVLLALVALIASLLAVALPASADTANNLVVTTASTPFQTTISPGTSLTGLRNLDTITVNVSATGTGSPASVIYSLDARLCRTGLNISLIGQFNASAGNCITDPLSVGSSAFVQKTIGSPNTSSSLSFIVGTGTEASHTGPGSAITCDSTHPCSLWLREAVPTGIILSGNAFVHYDLTFAGVPGPPTSVTAVAGAGTAAVSWVAPTNSGNWPLKSYLVTASSGGATCVATAPDLGCTVEGLNPLASYTFDVVATNKNPSTNATGYTGAAGTSNSVTLPAGTTPGVTTLVPGGGHVQVSWSASSPAATSYLVESFQGVVAGPTCTTSAVTCDVTGLTNGKPYKFMVTATFAGGSTVASALSAASTPKVTADLVATGALPNSTSRAQGDNVTMAVTNNGPDAVIGIMTLTFTGTTEHLMTEDSGIVCEAAVPNAAATAYTRICTTTDVLASGASKHVYFELDAKSPMISSIAATNVVSFPKTSPAAVDPDKTNNKVSSTEIITDSFDLAAATTGLTTVARLATLANSGTVTNNGTDPVVVKLVGVVTSAGVAVGAHTGLTCNFVANAAATGGTETCISDAPLASGNSLSTDLVLTPSQAITVHGLSVSWTASKLYANTIDPTPVDNKAKLTATITDSADLAATLTGSSSVSRGATVTLTGTIVNNGPNAITGKTVIKVTGGTITSITPDAGLACTGSGATRTCTFTTPLGSGASIGFSMVVTQVGAATTAVTATSTVSVLGGAAVTDPDVNNNVATKTVTVT